MINIEGFIYFFFVSFVIEDGEKKILKIMHIDTHTHHTLSLSPQDLSLSLS